MKKIKDLPANIKNRVHTLIKGVPANATIDDVLTCIDKLSLVSDSPMLDDLESDLIRLIPME